jgi:hypothetical protein
MIACDNHAVHGTRRGTAEHHHTVAEVRACFAGTNIPTHEDSVRARDAYRAYWDGIDAQRDEEADLANWEWEMERQAALGPEDHRIANGI